MSTPVIGFQRRCRLQSASIPGENNAFLLADILRPRLHARQNNNDPDQTQSYLTHGQFPVQLVQNLRPAPQQHGAETDYENIYAQRRRFVCCDRSWILWMSIVLALVNGIVVPGSVVLMLHVLKATNSSLVSSCPESPNDSGCNVSSSEQTQADLKRLFQKSTQAAIKAEIEKLQPPVDQMGTLSSTLQQNKNKSQQCASLFFLYEDDSTKSLTENWNDFTRVRGWSSDGNVAYQTRRCMGYDDATGEITVYQPGIYLIYSHLAFFWKKPNVNPRTNTSTTSRVLGHRIQNVVRVRERYGPTSLTLAKDTRAVQDVDPTVGHVPSYNSRAMTVAFLRERNATLAVEAKAVHLLMRENAVSSFLIYRLA